MLPGPSSSTLSSPVPRSLIFTHSSHLSRKFNRNRRSPPSQLLPQRTPQISIESRTSSGSFQLENISCRAASPAEAVTESNRESPEIGDVSLETEGVQTSVGIGSPNLPVNLRSFRASLGDQAFFALAFITCTTSIAFTSLIIAMIPTLLAMRRAAISLAKLADTAREELPSTMAAIRLSGMELSDLTLELSDLSQDIADGVNKSAQAVQAAEAGIRKIGQMARHQTMTIIQERAVLPDISLQPVVKGAAKKTSNAIGKVRKSIFDFISDRMDR